MKLVSKFALALSLVAVSAAPAAFAQSDEKPKKEKKGREATPAAPKKNYSKPFIAAYMPVANLLNKTKDAVAAKAEFPKVVAAIANDDDRYEAGILAVNIGVLVKDPVLQDQGIDLRLAVGLPDAAGRGVGIALIDQFDANGAGVQPGAPARPGRLDRRRPPAGALPAAAAQDPVGRRTRPLTRRPSHRPTPTSRAA